MRARRSGTIIQMSSVAAHHSFPGFAAYNATKAALEGLSQTLATEVGPLGIRVLIVEPGNFRTDFFLGSLRESRPLPDYQETVGALQNMMKAGSGRQQGDPFLAAEAILTVLASENPPLRLPLGGDCVDLLRADLASRGAEITAWEELARSTSFADAAP